MWDAVQHVSTGLALVAFLGAVAVVAYRANLKHRLNIITTVPRQRRAEVITKEPNAFGVDAKNLTPAQQFELAKREIDLRARRASYQTIVAVVAMCIFGGIAIFTIMAEGHGITGRSAAPSVTTGEPTDEDVERAIRACSAGTKADAALEGGLNLLKKRIVTGEGKFSQSEIPSVIGSGVQSDAAKITVFEQIQKCVVERVYGASPPPSPKADVELRFVYPQYPLLRVVNNSDSIAENVKYTVPVWNIDKPNDPNHVSIQLISACYRNRYNETWLILDAFIWVCVS